MRKIKFTMIILLLCLSLKLFATAQVADILVYKGDTIMLFANPLESNKLADKIRNSLKGCMNTACWRLYQAYWEIIDNELYLTDIKSCCYYEDNKKVDLKIFFGEKCKNGKVKADWVTGNLTAVLGKCVFYIHSDYESIYEKEILFSIDKGKIIKTETFNNSKTKISKFKDQEFINYIQKNINFDILPKKQTRVIVRFSGNENGVIDSVEVVRSTDSTENKIFEKEAIRVIKSIPKWDVIYKKGKFAREYGRYTFPVRFFYPTP